MLDDIHIDHPHLMVFFRGLVGYAGTRNLNHSGF